MIWHQIQIRYLFKIVSGSTPASGSPEFWDGDIPWITPEDVSRVGDEGVLSDTRRKITEEGYRNSGTTLVPKKSIVLTKRAPIGQLAILGIDACSNQGCFLLIPIAEVDSWYYFYFLLCQKETLHFLGRGSTFMELSTDDIKAFKVPFPEIHYQRRIAAYLDRETAHIDALIAAKECMLTLMAEKRQALIARAVTRGLDAQAKMKDSGVAWLGEVPRHWEMIRIKFLGDIYYGLSQPPEYQIEGLPLIRATNVFRGVIKKEGLVFVNESDLPASKKIVLRIGDIIIVRSGAYTADSALITEEWEGSIAGFDMVFRPGKRIYPKFLASVLLCGYVLDNRLIPMSSRAAQPHLNAEELGSVLIVVPSSIEEQIEIIEQLEKETTRLSALYTATEHSINLLRERRSALIAAAVTGQIKIPES